MKDKVEEIVRQVVVDYFNSNQTPLQPVNKKIFILLDEHPVPIGKSIWDLIHQLSTLYSLTICAPKAVKIEENLKVKRIFLDQEHIDVIKKEMNESDLFILANPQYSNLVKLALTIDDTLGMWITIQMQLDGKKIAFVNDFILHDGTQKVTSPQSLNERIQSYIRKLRGENVHFLPFNKLDKWISSYFEKDETKRHIVLAKHIKEIADEGKNELIVPAGSLITPVCKEYAKELGIFIKQKE